MWSPNYIYRRWWKSLLMRNWVSSESIACERKLLIGKNIIYYKLTFQRLYLVQSKNSGDSHALPLQRSHRRWLKPWIVLDKGLYCSHCSYCSTLFRSEAALIENLRCGWYYEIQNTEERRLGAGRSDKFEVDITKNNRWSFICYGKHHKLRHGMAFGKILI